MILQQPAAFMPFPREFVALFHIARWTSEHEVTHIVSRNISSRNAAQRKGVINMINILPFALLKLGTTTSSIVATIALAFQLFLDLCVSVSTKNLLFASNTIKRVCPSSLLMSQVVLLAILSITFLVQETLLFTISPFMLFVFLSISLAISFVMNRSQFSVCLSSLLTTWSRSILLTSLVSTLFTLMSQAIGCGFVEREVFQRGWEVSFASRTKLGFALRFSSFWGVCVVFSTIFLATFDTLLIQSIRRLICSSFIEKFSGSRFNLLAISTPFKSFWDRWQWLYGGFRAHPAYRAKPIFLVAVNGEIGERQKQFATVTLLALWGVLRYSIVHDRGLSLLSSRLWMFAASQGQNNIQLPQHYTTKPLHKQLQEVFYASC